MDASSYSVRCLLSHVFEMFWRLMHSLPPRVGDHWLSVELPGDALQVSTERTIRYYVRVAKRIMMGREDKEPYDEISISGELAVDVVKGFALP